MAFIEHRLNPDLTYDAVGGPEFNVSVAYSISGQRQTNRNTTYPLHRYNITHCLKTLADHKEIINLVYVAGGPADGFRFKDWADFSDEGQGVLTLVSGSTYQMYKRYPFQSLSFNRIIQKPVAGIKVFRTRASVTTDITGASSIDLTTGLVGVSGHLGGDTYTWTGQFDVPVAFVSKDFMRTIKARNGSGLLVQSPQIDLMEIRL